MRNQEERNGQSSLIYFACVPGYGPGFFFGASGCVLAGKAEGAGRSSTEHGRDPGNTVDSSWSSLPANESYFRYSWIRGDTGSIPGESVGRYPHCLEPVLGVQQRHEYNAIVAW